MKTQNPHRITRSVGHVAQIAFCILVLLLLAAATATAHASATASGTVVGYITVEENSTGIYVSIPEFNTLFNVTYSNYYLGALVINTSCILIRAYYINGTPITTLVDVYAVSNGTLLHVAKVLVSGDSSYCNASISNYTTLALVYDLQTVRIGPIAVVKPSVSTLIEVPPLLKPWFILFVVALAGSIVLSFVLRRMAVGLITAGVALYFLFMYLPVPAVLRFFPLLLIFGGVLSIVILEKNPEQ